MKYIVIFCLFARTLAFYSFFDGVEDVEKFMLDEVKFKSAMACYLDRGPCAEKELENKQHMLGSVMSYCADCDAKEKHKLEVMLKIMVKKYPQELEDFIKKYDLDGKHFAVIESDLAKY